MKILHTADWHIGKVLHLFDMEEDHRLFFNWMLELIKQEAIDVLIVAGDIFDHNNPSNESRKLYFELLKDLAELKLQIIITGGNHDSINMLQASKELLALLGIMVVAGVPDDFEKQVMPLHNKGGEVLAICAAVPFLRDKDLRSYVAGESSEDRINATRNGIIDHYVKCKKIISERYGDQYPTMATGHLYIQGATLSEGERDIQIGNQAGIESKKLEGLFDYMALGHIHIANRYGNGKIRYSGSPIALSFSEKEDVKTVIIIEVKEGQLVSRSVPVPKLRSLLKLAGKWQGIKEQIEMLQVENILPPLLELEIYENVAMIPSIEYEISTYKSNGINIVKRRFTPEKQEKASTEPLTFDRSIKEFNPNEVFLKKLETHDLSEEDKSLLMHTYAQLLEEVQSNVSL
jgi:DNA repair protein SbcD/Mre11